jgi:hypothetical protein
MHRQSNVFNAVLLFCVGLCVQFFAVRDAHTAQFQSATQREVDDEGHQWWQHAVFYELYPRSFADSSDDGVGVEESRSVPHKVNLPPFAVYIGQIGD